MSRSQVVECFRGADEYGRPYCAAHGNMWPCPEGVVNVLIAEARSEVARLERIAEISPDGYDMLNAIIDRWAAL